MFYDYTGTPRPPASQFYYPPQPTLYHAGHSPLLSSHVTVHVPPIVGDHKRDLQVGLILTLTLFRRLAEHFFPTDPPPWVRVWPSQVTAFPTPVPGLSPSVYSTCGLWEPSWSPSWDTGGDLRDAGSTRPSIL